MDINTRLAVTAELCCDCVRNAAYYHAAWTTPTALRNENSDFWVNLNGNFLDIAGLDWCFLFGDHKAEFRWQNVIEDETGFCSHLLDVLDYTESDLNGYVSAMRLYRDKRVAHRDRYLTGDPEIFYPSLDPAVKSASFLFAELVRIYPQMEKININRDLKLFYESRLKHGQRGYDSTNGDEV
ncbi:MAG: hypothetical protein R8L58_02690 [Mariprofundaceae bacterium]